MTTNKVQCGQGKCPFTDEFCASGDCPYDTDNMLKNNENFNTSEGNVKEDNTFNNQKREENHTFCKTNIAQRNSQDDELMKKIFPHKEIIEGESVLVFPYIEEASPLKDVPQEVVSNMEKTIDHIVDTTEKVSLKYLWSKRELDGAYYIKNGNGEYEVQIFQDKRKDYRFIGSPISEFVCEVPSYEQWQPFTDPYFKGLTTKDIAELAKKSIRLTKQSCEDNTTIQRLKELLCYCADVLEEMDDKDRDIEILLEEVNEVLR